MGQLESRTSLRVVGKTGFPKDSTRQPHLGQSTRVYLPPSERGRRQSFIARSSQCMRWSHCGEVESWASSQRVEQNQRLRWPQPGPTASATSLGSSWTTSICARCSDASSSVEDVSTLSPRVAVQFPCGVAKDTERSWQGTRPMRVGHGNCSGWSLHRPKHSGSVGRDELAKRADDLAQGRWWSLLNAAQQKNISRIPRTDQVDGFVRRGAAAQSRVARGQVSRARHERLSLVPQDVLNSGLEGELQLDAQLFARCLQSAPSGSSPEPGGLHERDAQGVFGRW